MMVRYLMLLVLLFSSVCSLQAQTLKETIRGKYGEYQGTAETSMRGGKAVTVYKDKYGQVTGTSESRTNSSGKTTTVYKDKYGQVTGKGSVRGRVPNKSNTYSYGYSKGKSK